MTRLFSSLRSRLMILVLLALIPAFGLVTYTASEQRRVVTARSEENALRIARAAAGNQEQLVESARQLLMALAELPAIREGDPATCSAFLARLLTRYPHYITFGVADRSGLVLCSASPNGRNANIGSDSLVQLVFDSRDFAVGDYRIGLSGRAVIGFGFPLLDDEHNVRSMLYTAVDLTWLNGFVAQSLMPDGSTLTVTDRHGVILARVPDPEMWVGRPLTATALARIVAGSDREGTFQDRGVDRVSRLYAFTTLTQGQERDLYISVGIPAAVAFADVNQMFARNLVTLGLVGLLTLAAAWVGGELFLLRQVRAFLAATERLAGGDLTARTGVRYGVGELMQLARAFDRMVDGLEQREAERKRAQEQNDRLYDTLRKEEQARASLLHNVITAQEDERRRIARELHDETSQSLVTLMVGLDRALMMLGDEAGKVAGHLRTVKFIAEGLLGDIHRLIEDLRPALLDVLGLESAIVSYGEQRLAPAGIDLRFDRQGLDGRLPASMETALFRIVQEGLTNVVRHAGASEARVKLIRERECLTLEITDNGHGFAPSLLSDAKGFGLRGIQERASILGGEFHVESAPGQGTRLEVRVPVGYEEMGHEDSRVGSG